MISKCIKAFSIIARTIFKNKMSYIGWSSVILIPKSTGKEDKKKWNGKNEEHEYVFDGKDITDSG